MSLLTRSLILADVPPPDGRTSNFNYCVKISNLKKYPDRLFFAQVRSQNSAENSMPYVLVRADRCVEMSGYRPMMTIGTISKNKVASKDLKKAGAETTLANPKILKALIKTKEPIARPFSLPDVNTGKNIVDVYAIKSIDKTSLNLTPGANNLAVSNLIIFPIVGAIILGWFAWKRHHNLTKS